MIARGKDWRLWLVCLLGSYIAATATLVAAQQEPPASRLAKPKLMLPHGPVKTLPSPDGSHILYGVPYRRGVNDGPELWIEDTRTGKRTSLLTISGTMTAEWSTDGTAFSINDHRASDSTLAYVYDSDTLRRTDIANRIRTADGGTERFANAHSYFDVDRWEDSQNLIVRFHGHTDDSPVVCFDLRYRVSRTGSVRKLSEHVSPATAHGCG